MRALVAVLLLAAALPAIAGSPKEQRAPECFCNGCHFPSLTECGQYYKCVSGRKVAHSCPEGQKFDPETRRCADAEKVDCEAQYFQLAFLEEDKCVDRSTHCRDLVKMGGCDCTPGTSCDWANFMINTCPSTCDVCNKDAKLCPWWWLQWIVNHWPWWKPKPVEPTAAPVEPTVAPVEPTEAPVVPTVAPVEPTEEPFVPPCRPCDCSYGTYHPHPSDCTMFIRCTASGPQEMPCPAGTRWDQTHLTCAHEDTTECVTVPGFCERKASACHGAEGRVASPSNPTEYLLCSASTAYAFTCADHATFSAKTGSCVYRDLLREYLAQKELYLN